MAATPQALVWGGRDFMAPDEYAADDGILGWLSRADITDPAEAALAAAEELAKNWYSGPTPSPEMLRLTPVLAREESQVEANINGHEFPLWVECTERARAPEPFWRVELKGAE